MKVKSILIEKLYNAYTYRMDIPSDGSTFLITGPNGYGKTTIINILYNLSIGRYIYFYTLKYNKIEIKFDDESVLHIEKKREDTTEDDDTSVDTFNSTEFRYFRSDMKDPSMYVLKYEQLYKETRDYLEGWQGDDGLYFDYTKGWRRRNKHIFINKSDTRIERIEKVIDSIPEIYNKIARMNRQEQFLLLLKRFECNYIQAERLVNSDNDSSESAIENVKSKIEKMLHEEYKNYLERAQEYDSNMINELINFDITSYNEVEYNLRAKEIKKIADIFSKYGIGNLLEIHDYNREKAEILTVHLKMMNEKINVLSNFIEKINIFSEAVEKKNFAHKILKIDFNRGITFISKESGEIIPINNLSSGEKNEIILLYNLIFKVKNDSILLIDEPENSLHVEWQSEFVDDIESIAKSCGIQVIIATHSPTIVGGRWDKTFDLYKENGIKRL